jgi:GDPmannose 4,6-dehydratase
MNKKNILIIGITGQDGALLSEILLKKKFNVIGTTTSNNLKNLIKLNIKNKLFIFYKKKYNKSFFLKIIKKFDINLIFYLSGQSSVSKSEILRNETIESNTKPLILILEILRTYKKNIKFLNAVSSEMYGSSKKKIDENSIVNPISFYGLSKSLSYEIVKCYREQFKLNLCNLILFNHESNLRPNHFVLKKIIYEVKKIKEKKIKNKKLIVGNLDIKRDWGWAPEYVKLIYKIGISKYKEDFVIGTGKSHKLKFVVKKIFKMNKLSIKRNVKISKKFIRKYEILENFSNINKIQRYFNWKPKYTLTKIIGELQKK